MPKSAITKSSLLYKLCVPYEVKRKDQESKLYAAKEDLRTKVLEALERAAIRCNFPSEPIELFINEKAILKDDAVEVVRTLLKTEGLVGTVFCFNRRMLITLDLTTTYNKMKHLFDDAPEDAPIAEFVSQEHLFECKICLLPMKSAMVGDCGHILCKECCDKNGRKLVKCPFCRGKVNVKRLYL